MLTRLEKAQQKWGGSHSVIDKWLTERQELLVLFCRIAGFSPYEKKITPFLINCKFKTFAKF